MTYLDTTVYIRTWHLMIPGHDRVYHQQKHRSYGYDSDGVWHAESTSRCGLTLNKWEGDVNSEPYESFHESVAREIARPCRHCYEVTP